VEQNSSGGALIGSAFILGIAIVGSSFLLSSSLDRASEQFGTAVASIKDFKPAAAAAAAPARKDGRPDPNKVYQVAVGKSPFVGPKDAKITIVEFSDFQ
jgi:protein-disulfide isomerase